MGRGIFHPKAVNTTANAVIATITVTPASADLAYIPSYRNDSVSVINLATNEVVSTIPVGGLPWGIAVGHDGSHVYVGNSGSSSISVIDVTTQVVSATIQTGLTPIGILISPDGSRLYVANSGDGTISVISTATNALVSTISADMGQDPYGLAISPDGGLLYVTNMNKGEVSVINISLNAVIATISVGIGPVGLAITPDGATLYVANNSIGSISVINTSSNTVVGTITAGVTPQNIVVSADGSRAYVTNVSSGSVSVINTLTNMVIATIPAGTAPDGLSLAADGSRLYVTDAVSSTLSVIDLSTSQIISTVKVGVLPFSFGNFLVPGTGCTGPHTKFTITVNPTAITSDIMATTATGTIAGCEGSASVSPNVQQFTVTGSELTNSISLTAPNNFEISMAPGSGFGGKLTLPAVGGTVYVRSAASAPVGSISGNVDAVSPGATPIFMPVTGIVYAPPSADPVGNQIFTNGMATTPVNFTGTATSFNWTNDKPGIGLPASGTGSIPPFTATNTSNSPITANITLTPVSAQGCTGVPVTFTVTVEPTGPPGITATGTLSPLTTTYGTPSPSESFNVSGTGLTAGIFVTPPAGFEVSTDNVNFTGTVTAGTGGTIASTPVYIRLAATTLVNNYSGNIVLSSAGATNNVVMPLSTVSKTLLTIIADDKNKIFGTPNPVLTAGYFGFVNNEGPAILITLPVLTTIATTTSAVGLYPITVSGGTSLNYTINTIDGTLTVLPSEQSIVIPNTFTPNGDGINDTWDIKNLNFYLNCMVDIYNRYGEMVYSSIGYGKPWNGTYKGAALPTGTYYYIINLKNGLKVLSGFVAVIR